MRMHYFARKWANKVIKEYEERNDLDTLHDEHFCLCFRQVDALLEDMQKVQISPRHGRMNEEQKKDFLLDLVQDQIDQYLIRE